MIKCCSSLSVLRKEFLVSQASLELDAYIDLEISEPSVSQILRFWDLAGTHSKVLNLKDLFLRCLAKSKIVQTVSTSSQPTSSE